MNGLIIAAGSVGLALLAGLVVAIIWLSKSHKAQAQAEVETDALRQGQKLHGKAARIMQEPVAYEPRWIVAARERLRGRDGKS